MNHPLAIIRDNTQNETSRLLVTEDANAQITHVVHNNISRSLKRDFEADLVYSEMVMIWDKSGKTNEDMSSSRNLRSCFKR